MGRERGTVLGKRGGFWLREQTLFTSSTVATSGVFQARQRVDQPPSTSSFPRNTVCPLSPFSNSAVSSLSQSPQKSHGRNPPAVVVRPRLLLPRISSLVSPLRLPPLLRGTTLPRHPSPNLPHNRPGSLYRSRLQDGRVQVRHPRLVLRQFSVLLHSFDGTAGVFGKAGSVRGRD